MSLDKLRALTEADCDDTHDWTECKKPACNQSICTRCCTLNTAARELLLPLAEALEKAVMRCCALNDDGSECREIATTNWTDYDISTWGCPPHDNEYHMIAANRSDYEGGRLVRAVLAQLEEALK